jgi:hypothetical protein
MTIATFHDSIPIFGWATVSLLACAVPFLWARWTMHGTRWALYIAAPVTAAGALGIALSGGLLWLILIGGASAVAILARHHTDRAGRIVAAGVVIAAGLPLYGLTLLMFVLAFAAIGCAPDAYECPV